MQLSRGPCEHRIFKYLRSTSRILKYKNNYGLQFLRIPARAIRRSLHAYPLLTQSLPQAYLQKNDGLQFLKKQWFDIRVVSK